MNVLPTLSISDIMIFYDDLTILIYTMMHASHYDSSCCTCYIIHVIRYACYMVLPFLVRYRLSIMGVDYACYGCDTMMVLFLC